ncbi:pyridoxal-phosphate-dependent aminotransferase family protein [Aneurinibacillus tyrosinisolvens]|uniref:pyridoxal-phosphate-dependent aminotransferase family protein n=1 Tax=Aneurinibacillus tyrosinisolvens TaxID=1443435 RepID=UPI0009E34EF9|nr:alanine--glyoxylate aminotransferase family protein [Aneurinibacillus tyrosinisolvens]
MYKDFNPSLRTIMTPGPVEVEPRVLRAMAAPILGQFDPEFTHIMNETMEMIRRVFQTKNKWAFPVDGTSRAGIEAVLCSIIEPGDRVLVPIYGRFGYLLTEIAERYGAEVINIETEWGQVFEPSAVIKEIQRTKPKIVAMVHGETSTGCMQPLQEIGEACREFDVIFVVDAVASIGGTEVKVDEWKIDAAIGGTQKCLSIPSGMAPITFNSRVESILLQRKKIEKGLADPHMPQYGQTRVIRSNYFDLSQLMDYWSPTRLNHHTEATSMLYALREGLRIVLEEGLENRFSRHRLHERALIQGILAMGLELYGNHAYKLPVVTCICVPEGVDGESVRSMLLHDFDIEIASSFGPLKGKIWRIGTMGYSCRKKNVLHVLGALEGVLIRHGVKVHPGQAVQAALDVYQNKEHTAIYPQGFL